MRRFAVTIFFATLVLAVPSMALAASNPEVQQFTNEALTVFIGLAIVAATFFIVRAGYLYITSSGNPETLFEAKKTIKLALIGLVMVIGTSIFSSLLGSAFDGSSGAAGGATLSLVPIEAATPASSLTQIILDAITGFLKNIIESATRPILDGIIGFLTNTPSLVSNSVVFNFWLIMVGITDSLFALVIALLGFQVMSASSFGFSEISLKELLPRIALAFVAANTSIFLIDWLVSLCQTLIHAVLNATGGIGQAWILNAMDPVALLSGATVLITLIFMLIFLVLAIVLLIFYIARLMLLAFGAVISPLICLLWLLPKWSDFADTAFRGYLVTIFTLFTHVVIIQLASAFLTVPGQVGTNPFISIIIGIALFGLLLKSTTATMQLVLASQTTGSFKKFGAQLFNVISAKTATTASSQPTPHATTPVRRHR